MSTPHPPWEHTSHSDESPVDSHVGPAGRDAAPSEVEQHRAERARVEVTPTPPTTGDEDVDAVLADVARAQASDLSARIEVAEQAQRVLHARLSDLGGA